MKLIKTRECDGSCCRQSPQFPNDENSDCIYHIDNGCELMRKPEKLNLLSDFDCNKFNVACKEWPDNMPKRETGDCCLQWVDNG